MGRSRTARRRFLIPGTVLLALMTTILSPLPTAFAEIPTITGFSPTTGGEGTRVVIVGRGFDERSVGSGNCLAAAVQFGPTDAARFVVDSDRQITATVGREGSGPITVTTEGDHCGPVRSDSEFIWTSKIASVTYDGNGATSGTVPIDGTTPYAIGDSVTVLGNIGSLERRGYVFSDWNTARDGSGARYRAGDTFKIEADTILYAQWWLPAPTVTSFTPTSGGAGTSVVITGTNLLNATAVRFGGTNAASYVVNSSTQITAIVDGGATGKVTVVTAGGAATSLATFTFLSSDATLSALTISAGTLSPTFDSGTLNYTSSVGYATASMTVTPTLHESHATVTVNGTTVTSGTPSGPITLSLGANVITVIVTAQDGSTTRTYTVTVTKTAPSSTSDLHSLLISTGSLAPSFDSDILTYTASVNNSTTSITVTPTVDESHATVKVNGTSVTSGTASGAIALTVGANVITIVVTAEDGSTTSTYTVTVTRSAPDGGTSALSGLTISAGTLAPTFASGTLTYTASVRHATTSITVTPTVRESNATVTVNGTSVTSGTASGAIALTVGANVITIVVTAQDGITTVTYTVTVTRNELSTTSDLHSLLISEGTLAPTFDPEILTYTAWVNDATAWITVTPTVDQSQATVKVNGTSVTSGTPSAPIELSIGANIITIVVTAEDGNATDTYTLTVTRGPVTTPSTPITVTVPIATFETPVTEGLEGNETEESTIEASLENASGIEMIVSVTVPVGAISTAATVSIRSGITRAEAISGTIIIEVSVTDSAGLSITRFDKPLIINLGHVAIGSTVVFSQNGSSWVPIRLLSGSSLPDAVPEGYYVGADGHTIILTRHLTFFGVKKNQEVLLLTLSSDTMKVKGHLRVTSSGGSGHGVESFITMTPTICSVSHSGFLRGLSGGECKIQAAKDGGDAYFQALSDVATLTVQKIAQRKLFVLAIAHSLRVGESARLIAHGGTGKGVVEFTTADPTICSVSSTGLLKARSAGICSIVASKSGNGTYLEASSMPLRLTIQKSAPPVIKTITVTGHNLWKQITVAFGAQYANQPIVIEIRFAGSANYVSLAQVRLNDVGRVTTLRAAPAKSTIRVLLKGRSQVAIRL